MTEKQWEVELRATVQGSPWAVAWYGVLQQYPTCVADVHHLVTGETKQIELSRDVFRTPEARAAETRRQLQG